MKPVLKTASSARQRRVKKESNRSVSEHLLHLTLGMALSNFHRLFNVVLPPPTSHRLFTTLACTFPDVLQKYTHEIVNYRKKPDPKLIFSTSGSHHTHTQDDHDVHLNNSSVRNRLGRIKRVRSVFTASDTPPNSPRRRKHRRTFTYSGTSPIVRFPRSRGNPDPAASI